MGSGVALRCDIGGHSWGQGGLGPPLPPILFPQGSLQAPALGMWWTRREGH